MSERIATCSWPGDSIGLAGEEPFDRWVAFMMNGSLEMGNVCDTTAKSQGSVSRTPEKRNYNSEFLSQDR